MISAEIENKDKLNINTQKELIIATATENDKSESIRDEWGGAFAEFDSGSFSAGVKYNEHENTNDTITNTAIVNNITSGNNINIKSKENILSQGSQIQANNNIIIYKNENCEKTFNIRFFNENIWVL